jgi:hypothetical protein
VAFCLLESGPCTRRLSTLEPLGAEVELGRISS